MLKYLPIIISLISFIYKPLAQYSQSNRSFKVKRTNSSVLTPAPLQRWPPSRSNVTEIKKEKKKRKKTKATPERSLRMNYVADQPVTASFLGGIYSGGSDRSYLKAERYEFSPTDKKTKRSACTSQPGAARGIYQWNELAPDLAPD